MQQRIYYFAFTENELLNAELLNNKIYDQIEETDGIYQYTIISIKTVPSLSTNKYIIEIIIKVLNRIPEHRRKDWEED